MTVSHTRKIPILLLGLFLAAVLLGCGNRNSGGPEASGVYAAPPDVGALQKYMARYVSLLNEGNAPELAKHLGDPNSKQDAALRIEKYGRQQWRDASFECESKGISADIYDIRITATNGTTAAPIRIDERAHWFGHEKKWHLAGLIETKADPQKPTSGIDPPSTVG
ncbi:hypothetical protein [Embleya sp. NPDC020630]|uniref:hypothetical protein n=1 Tax=Embleya sp. NPDC020630 TaxID=3363979 RepID=UPI0037AEC800